MSDRQSIIAEKTKLEKELEALETVINMFGIDITKDISSFGENTLSPQEQRDYQLISHYNEKKNEIETLEKQLAPEPEWLKKEIQAQTDMQRDVQIKAAKQAPNPTVREILLAADPATNAKYNALRRILREEEEELEKFDEYSENYKEFLEKDTKMSQDEKEATILNIDEQHKVISDNIEDIKQKLKEIVSSSKGGKRKRSKKSKSKKNKTKKSNRKVKTEKKRRKSKRK